VWETSYTAEEYIALLNSFSGHISMDPPKRAHLYREIRRRIGERPDPRMRRHWYAMLYVAVRARRPLHEAVDSFVFFGWRCRRGVTPAEPPGWPS
jgi:hypothetical protein